MSGKWGYRLAGAVIVCLAAARIVSTYGEFTQTFDEPFHIACGMQLLSQGIYTIELQHPPLARLLDALGPYVAGLRPPASGDAVQLGNGILLDGGRYRRNLALARLGSLPFFLLACAVVWFWTSHLADRRTALAALFIFSMLPPILAHGALATTDMASTATILLAFYCLVLWMEDSTLKRSAGVGFATGLAIVSKFSAILFLPVCAAVLLLLYGRVLAQQPFRRLARNLAVACLAGYFVISAGYLFTMEPVLGPPPHPAVEHFLHSIPVLRSAVNGLLDIPVPAGQLPRSVIELAAHNSGGHTAFFLGEWRKGGWWYYFPVILLVKTPLAFLLLVPAGVFFLLRRSGKPPNWLALAPCWFSLAILSSALFSHIDIGLRHILVIYPLLSIAAGHGLCQLWDSAARRGIERIAAAALAFSLTASSVLAHPNYLAYFNILAAHPENIEVDSDLDWGQDLGRLAKWLHAHNVQEVSLCYFGTVDLAHAGLPEFQELQPYAKTSGWIAISAYNRALPAPFVVKQVPGRAAYYAIPSNFDSIPHAEGPFAWIKNYSPVAKIGSSIFVYQIP